MVAYCIAAWARAYIRSAPTGTLNGRKTHGGTVTKQTGPKTKTADSKPARKGHLPQELLMMSRKNASRPGQSLTLSRLFVTFSFLLTVRYLRNRNTNTLSVSAPIPPQTRPTKHGLDRGDWPQSFLLLPILVPKAINNNQRRAATKRPTPSYTIRNLLAVGIPSVHSHLR